MKFLRVFYMVLLLLHLPVVRAADMDDKIKLSFAGKESCFLLYDVQHDRMLYHYNDKRCATRIPVDSTFKIALSLMAFDQGLITQQSVFKWDGLKRDFSSWNQDQTPKTWLQHSVVWVSQELTPKLGIKNIQHYLHQFHYGNEDFSGDPGKHNGITHAWLDSSLKISADEQLTFLKRLFAESLPVSKQAQRNTKQNLFLKNLEGGWKLYGKTGSTPHRPDGTMEGWFVGCVEKGEQRLIVITNFSGDYRSELELQQAYGGHVAKRIALDILHQII